MARTESQNLTEVSRLSSASCMRGNLVSTSDVRIDGKFEGRIVTTGKVVIGEGAIVEGELVSGSADIWGRLQGNIVVGDVLSLKSGCDVSGDIQAVRISIELDSKLNGNCKIIAKEEFEAISSQNHE